MRVRISDDEIANEMSNDVIFLNEKIVAKDMFQAIKIFQSKYRSTKENHIEIHTINLLNKI
jgi:hypothetical protein